MKRVLEVMLSITFAVGMTGIAIAGSIDSPGTPSSGSGMYTLLQIYDYLNSGTTATIPDSFQEPSAAPASTMKTTRQIYDDIKTKFEECDATTYDVALGKKFFSTQSGAWGVQTGRVCIAGTPTPTPTVTPLPTATPPTWCTSAGGYWYPTEAGSGSSGCWFVATANNTSCNSVCGNKGLTCQAGNWNDDASCSVMNHFVSCTACYVQTGDYRWLPGFEVSQTLCWRREQSVSQECSNGSSGWTMKRVCVCQ
ncbi:MAG: hypothetical protein NTZ78_03785 [Candidatus Aureabacteria bacterium]|nr:hypothetical protein [Candidatus Auribacterota bacterium]